MIKGVIMSTGKMKVLVVSGFLGAGKTTWIKMLIDHNPVRGKLALIGMISARSMWTVL